MKMICIDQGMYRSEALAKLIADPDMLFVIPDAALMEMCKSTRWEQTLRGSLEQLATVPDRVFLARGNGECLKAELDRGRPLELDDLISLEATEWLRAILVEIAHRRHGERLEVMAAEIEKVNATARTDYLDDMQNLASLRGLISTLESAYTADFQKRLRSGKVGEDEYVAVVSNAAASVVNDGSMKLSAGWVDTFFTARSYAARWLWLRVETVTEWLAKGGVENVAASKVTNSDVDRHYLVLASYCDQLLTGDRAMQEKDRKLRAALAHPMPWIVGHPHGESGEE